MGKYYTAVIVGAGQAGLAMSRSLTDLSIDHIVPIARGGEHEWDNVQPAHLGCNIQKNDRVA
jgi:5-methylcytosine-specific restriction endonuclease McrA